MNIYLDLSDELTVINEYLEFNRVPYEKISLWHDIDKKICISKLTDQLGSLLIINFATFVTLITNNSDENVIKFIKNNHLWVWNDIDGVLVTIDCLQHIAKFNKKVGTESHITFFLDGELDVKITSTQLSNIKCISFPQNHFIKYPRLKNSVTTKNKNARDFLLTMITRKNRPHRLLLENELLKRKSLLDHGHIVIHKNSSMSKSTWVGEKNHQNSWWDGYPSMDLYRDSLIELVPETLCRDGYFITEKTIKSIATKTPFLIVSTPGYLNYLKQQGFKTFSNIIDESYDLEDNLETRISLVIDLLEYIVKNNTQDFYQECLPILEHNQRRLFELTGSWHFNTDNFINFHLHNIGLG